MRSGTRKPGTAKRGTVGAMLQEATDAMRDERPAVPSPRTAEQPPPVDPELFNFADIERVAVEQAELDAAAASWDGFL